MHHFNKDSVCYFSERTSVDIKFDTLSKSYKEFKKLDDVKNKTKKTKQTQITVPSASLFYEEWVKDYKK